VLRPRFALATATVMIVAGALLGVRNGSQMAHQDAQARYLAAVAPNSLR
jgi:Mg2+/citrate symporter